MEQTQNNDACLQLIDMVLQDFRLIQYGLPKISAAQIDEMKKKYLDYQPAKDSVENKIQAFQVMLENSIEINRLDKDKVYQIKLNVNRDNIKDVDAFIQVLSSALKRIEAKGYTFLVTPFSNDFDIEFVEK